MRNAIGDTFWSQTVDEDEGLYYLAFWSEQGGTWTVSLELGPPDYDPYEIMFGPKFSLSGLTCADADDCVAVGRATVYELVPLLLEGESGDML